MKNKLNDISQIHSLLLDMVNYTDKCGSLLLLDYSDKSSLLINLLYLFRRGLDENLFEAHSIWINLI